VPVEEPSTASQADICSAANGALYSITLSARRKAGGDRVADSLRRFQVDNEFKSRWLLEGKIGRLCTDRVLAMLIVSAAHRTGAARLTRARYPPLG
jgi:hypothetical protein